MSSQLKTRLLALQLSTTNLREALEAFQADIREAWEQAEDDQALGEIFDLLEYEIVPSATELEDLLGTLKL